MRSSIIGWSLKNKSVVILAAVLLIASGVYATTRLNQELLPNIEFPTIAIATPVPGAGPELVDEQVTQPIESALGNVQGIDSTQSTSSQGFSVVLVQLSLDADAKQAEDEIHHDSLDDAIVEAGRARLRPILMTALVTIGALTPLALGVGGGGTLISSSLAILVIGGLATSTFLTLLVVPVGYSVPEGARARMRKRKS